MSRIPEIFSASIVAVGAFNPAIFSPDWLERNNLIGPEDAKSARESEGLLYSRQVSVVDTDWFVLQVLEEQLTLSSKGALSPTLKDLAVSIFSLVAQTPINAIGLNFLGDYKISTVQDFHKIGDVLAPKKIWHEIFPPADQNVGMVNLSVSVQKGKRGDIIVVDDKKVISAQISSKFNNGIHLLMNNHYDISKIDQKERTSAEYVAKIIDDEWQASWDEALEVFDKLITLSLAEK